MAEIISKDFNSNCMLESFKQKLQHPKKIKITYIRPRYGESYFFVPHFLWSDGEHDYDFGTEKHLKFYQVLCFKGNIRRRKLGWNQSYKGARIKKIDEREKITKNE